MNDAEFQQRIDELDQSIPKDGAKLLIAYEEGVYCEFIANKAGYLRAGIEMLRAAVEPLGPGESVTQVNLNYLVGERGLLVRPLIRRDNVEAAFQPPGKKKVTVKQYVGRVGCITIFLCLVAFTLIGAAEVFNWILGK